MGHRNRLDPTAAPSGTALTQVRLEHAAHDDGGLGGQLRGGLPLLGEQVFDPGRALHVPAAVPNSRNCTLPLDRRSVAQPRISTVSPTCPAAFRMRIAGRRTGHLRLAHGGLQGLSAHKNAPLPATGPGRAAGAMRGTGADLCLRGSAHKRR